MENGSAKESEAKQKQVFSDFVKMLFGSVAAWRVAVGLSWGVIVFIAGTVGVQIWTMRGELIKLAAAVEPIAEIKSNVTGINTRLQGVETSVGALGDLPKNAAKLSVSA